MINDVHVHPNNSHNDHIDHNDNLNDRNKTTKKRRRIFVRQNLFREFNAPIFQQAPLPSLKTGLMCHQRLDYTIKK